MTAGRLASGGTWIDRAKPISFTFDGEEVAAFVGDTIASAILANGIEAPFRSPVLGRPRGVFSAGAEEPNAFVEISEPWFDPIVAATMVDVVDGMVVGSRPGVGRLRGEAAVPAARRAPERARRAARGRERARRVLPGPRRRRAWGNA